MSSARRLETRKFGRSSRGTTHALFIAFSVALSTPSPAHSVIRIPGASTHPLPVSECTFLEI